ncbi:glycosyltransferase [Ferruginibacter lapsinanis]|uniref:glycosyltransferase n=1 Tax=Ferruginibacter lapsinanis TaxID=563172 RepID=UPI001E5DC0E4|nr:glycosyltransferase [Ferruginibacter lapsinanis]UEG49447.1 glycosyltransferase [Ferruginibacter lapsinanis]
MIQEKRKRILILIDWFAPGYKAGGPIQSCVNIAFALKDEFEVFVLTTDTDHGEIVPYSNVSTNEWIDYEQSGIMVYYARKRSLSFDQIKNEITSVNADFVYLNLLFSPYFAIYPLWLHFRNKISGKVILCPRGTLYESALSYKAYKKRPFVFLYKLMGIAKKIKFHATNEREFEAIQKYFPGSNVVIADNLPNTNQPAFTGCIKNVGSLHCIFIARIVAIKNLLFLLNVLENVKADVLLTIVGPAEDNNYWETCKQKIATLPDNIKTTYLGAKQNNELLRLLQQNHLFVLPTTGENFGHAIFESFLAGRPVLISDQTPWLGLKQYKAGWDLPLAKPELFTEAIEQLASCDQQEFDTYANSAWQYANNFISDPTLKQQYYKLFL